MLNRGMKGINMKIKKETIDISQKWEDQLPLYLDLYSKLNDEGKKEMQRQLTCLGKLIDLVQQKRKEKENA